MTGIQHCCRKLLLFNTSRLINKNGVLLHSSRGRHQLVFQISSPRNRMALQRSKFAFNANSAKNFTFRLASTSAPTLKETISDAVPPVIVDDENKSNELTSNAEFAQSSNSSEIIDVSTLPPAPLADVAEMPVVEFVSTGLKEPSFESLGLGNWWPSGIIQQVLEYLHVDLDLPWWQAIIAMTVVSRILLFPVNLKSRKDSVNMMNHLPHITKIQEKITAARTAGDFYTVAALTNDMQTFIKEKNIKMFGVFRTAIIQIPIFFAMYSGLKGMVNCPVESLKTEGLFWFQDLTVADPYYILPALLSCTLLVIIEVGAEGNPAQANTHTVKWLLRAFPVVIFGITTTFSSCITYYWTISNLIVLLQVAFLKIPAVSSFFKIPKRIKHDEQKRQSKQGFIKGFKEGIENAKILNEIENRHQINLVEFQRAGSGPVPRTFKKNPLLQKEKNN